MFVLFTEFGLGENGVTPLVGGVSSKHKLEVGVGTCRVYSQRVMTLFDSVHTNTPAC